jgi:hypothetical protein
MSGCHFCADDRGRAITRAHHSGISYGRLWGWQDAIMHTYQRNMGFEDWRQDQAFARGRYEAWLARATEGIR